MADLTQGQITEAFKEALQWGKYNNIFGGGGSGGGSPSPSTPSTPTSGANVLGDLKKEASAVGNGFVALGKAGLDVSQNLLIGGARVSDATKALSSNMAGMSQDGTLVGKALSFVSEAGNKLGMHLDENIDTWRNLSKSGASFGNDIISMKQQASEARLSIAEMSQVVQKNTTNIAGLGPTVSQSIKAFTTVSNEMFKSGAAEELRKMGVTTQELNDVLAVSLSNRRITDLKDEASRKKAYESAAALATEMDAVAKITGKNKEAQLDELRRREADGQRQAAIDSAVAKGGANAKAAFDLLETTADAGGENFKKLAQDIAAMKRPSEGMETAYAALGRDAQKYLQMAGEAARSGNEKQAQEYTKMALEARANFQKTESYRTLAANGLKEFSDQYGQGGQFRKAMDSAGGSLKDLDKNVKDAQKGLETDPTTGKRVSQDSTKALTEFAVNVESRGRDVTKALTDQLIVPLTEKIGPTLKVFSDKLGDPKLIAEFEKQIKTGRVGQEGIGSVKDALTDKDTAAKLNSYIAKGDKNASEVEKLVLLLRSDATKDKVTTKLEDIAKKQGVDVQTVINTAMANKGAGVSALNRQLESVLSPEDIRKAEREKAEKEKRQEERKGSTLGSLAAADIAGNTGTTVGEGLGKAIGELGLFVSKPGLVTIANLPANAEGGYISKPTISSLAENGPEFVLNQPQMKSLIEGLGGQGLDISKISKEVSTTISSTTGGGASTIKGPDIAELAKPFEKSISQIVAESQGVELGSSKPSLSNISFGPNGMPMFRQAEAAKNSLPDKSPEKLAEEKEAKRIAAQKEQAIEKKEETIPATSSKASSLDDVVKQLNQLNKLMGQFVDDHKEIGAKQIRAAKGAGSSNINERV